MPWSWVVAQDRSTQSVAAARRSSAGAAAGLHGVLHQEVGVAVGEGAAGACGQRRAPRDQLQVAVYAVDPVLREVGGELVEHRPRQRRGEELRAGQAQRRALARRAAAAARARRRRPGSRRTAPRPPHAVRWWPPSPADPPVTRTTRARRPRRTRPPRRTTRPPAGSSGKSLAYTESSRFTSRGAAGASVLPRVDHVDRPLVRPRRLHRHQRHRGPGPQLDRQHHAEVAAARATQRPEQVRVLVGGGPHGPAVGQQHPRRDQVVRAEAVVPAEHPVPAAQHRADHADRPAPPDRRHERRLRERVGERADPHPGADDHRVRAHLDRSQADKIQHHAGRRGVFGEAVPAAAHGEPQAVRTHVRERGHHVGLGGALHDGRGQHLGLPPDEQLPRLLVAGVPGPVGDHGVAYRSACSRYSSAYRPSSASSESWVPCSASSPLCSR